MANRKQLSTRTRFEVFKRDEFTCQYCGAHPPEAVLHVDHIIAVANGGTNDSDNLVTACSSCNLGKSDVLLSAVPQTLKDKADSIVERERQLAGYAEVMEAQRARIERDCWRVIEDLFPGTKSICRPWYGSVKRFVEQLGVFGVLDAVEITKAWGGSNSDSRVFRYFCAVCWNKIRAESN